MTGGDALARAAGHRAPMRRFWRCCRAAAPAKSASSLPVFRDAVAIAGAKIPGPGHGPADRAACGARGCARRRPDWPTPLHILESEDDKYAAFDAADVALAASGTVTAELALARTPMVVAYRVGGLTYALANRLMTVPYMTLVNILLGRAGGAGIQAV